MAYNRINLLRKYIKVAEIVKEHYIDGVTTYKGVWKEYVCPVYPMSYQSFMGIMSEPNLKGQLAAELLKRGMAEEKVEEKYDGQMTIFDVPGVE